MSKPVYLGMPHNMGPQFIRVFRGLHANHFHDQKMENIDLEDIGPHWTTDHSVAEAEASGNISFTNPENAQIIRRKPGVHGIVLEGLLHKDDIKPYKHEDKDLNLLNVYPPEHHEAEVTAKSNSNVLLTRTAKFRVDPVGKKEKKLLNKIDYVESQDFSTPVKATVQPWEGDTPKGKSYVARQILKGRKATFDTELEKHSINGKKFMTAKDINNIEILEQ